MECEPTSTASVMTRSAGGSQFNVWGWVAPNDAWANSDSVLQNDHPKYRAIVDFVRGSTP